jgi:hypothetical protein
MRELRTAFMQEDSEDTGVLPLPIFVELFRKCIKPNNYELEFPLTEFISDDKGNSVLSRLSQLVDGYSFLPHHMRDNYKNTSGNLEFLLPTTAYEHMQKVWMKDCIF